MFDKSFKFKICLKIKILFKHVWKIIKTSEQI